jgi:hypothetical protein
MPVSFQKIRIPNRNTTILNNFKSNNDIETMGIVLLRGITHNQKIDLLDILSYLPNSISLYIDADISGITFQEYKTEAIPTAYFQNPLVFGMSVSDFVPLNVISKFSVYIDLLFYVRTEELVTPTWI